MSLKTSDQPVNQSSAFIKIIGDKTVLAEIILLLADIRHVLNDGSTEVFVVKVNGTKGSNPILLTVNDQEIADYKPQFKTMIN